METTFLDQQVEGSRFRARTVAACDASAAAERNACPDCGERYEGTSYYCAECTARRIWSGERPRDVMKGRRP
jgi:hypothetical protein